MELLAYPLLSREEEGRIREFIGAVAVVGLGEQVKDRTIEVRRSCGLKLPDAIVAATALVSGADPCCSGTKKTALFTDESYGRGSQRDFGRTLDANVRSLSRGFGSMPHTIPLAGMDGAARRWLPVRHLKGTGRFERCSDVRCADYARRTAGAVRRNSGTGAADEYSWSSWRMRSRRFAPRGGIPSRLNRPSRRRAPGPQSMLPPPGNRYRTTRRRNPSADDLLEP